MSANTGKQKLPTIQDEDFSLLCEQTYPGEDVKKASSNSKEELIMLLRNRHFFPIEMYMDKIADTVIAMYALNEDQYEDLIFDDKEILTAAAEEAAAVEEIEENDEDDDSGIDDLLEDSSDSPEDDVATTGVKKEKKS